MAAHCLAFCTALMTTEPQELTPAPQTTASPASKGVWQQQKENLRLLAIALALALFIRTFIAEPRYIPSDSMLPTLHIGDRLVVEKVSYRLHAPQQGDIVVFEPPDALLAQGFTSDQALIKRVIGLPGQTVKVEAGTVYLDNQPLQESYIAEPPSYQMSPVLVPEHSLFVMGDNRNNSNDSHEWGVLPAERVIGRAVFRFFPVDRLGAVR